MDIRISKRTSAIGERQKLIPRKWTECLVAVWLPPGHGESWSYGQNWIPPINIRWGPLDNNHQSYHILQCVLKQAVHFFVELFRFFVLFIKIRDETSTNLKLNWSKHIRDNILTKKSLRYSFITWYKSKKQFSPTRPSGPSWSSSCNVFLSVCPLFILFFPRPLIGTQVTAFTTLSVTMASVLWKWKEM